VVSLEQVRALESRVEKAVSYIAALRTENAELRRRVEDEQSFIDEAAAELETGESARAAAESRAAELERALAEAEARFAEAETRFAEAEARASELAGRIEEYKRDQGRIEEGIVHALEKLDSFEDLILGQAAPRATAESVQSSAPRREAASEGQGESGQPRIEGSVPPAQPEVQPAAQPQIEAEPAAQPLRSVDATVGESASAPERPAADSQLDIF